MSSKNEPSLSKLNSICDQFEDVWRNGAVPNISDYLCQIKDAGRLALLRSLLQIDIEYRARQGHLVGPDVYASVGHGAVEMAQALLDDRLGKIDSQEMAQAALETNDCLDSHLTDSLWTEPKPADWIGPYRLLERIGEGGMGTVWVAEADKPLRRRVALKVVKIGQGTKQVIARFDAERQALAMMEHQNIAKVFDAGTTANGQPYFAMELVQGISISEFCNQHRLGINERLELFISVCQAVQHAHQKGIIHRDLKPSNVLVTLLDGHPIPKVIDFGLAKALDQRARLTDKTLFTEIGQIVGTLLYMSPEQAEVSDIDVDTRTDIYSLGVILYELLTGTTPIDKESLRGADLFAVLKSIREKEPPRPSARLSESEGMVVGISQQRRIDPRRLRQILRGELDWIVMKGLEKDRARRYDTAISFAEDVRRFLDGGVVVARPPSVAYKVSKFAKKYRSIVVTAMSIVVLLVAGVIGTTHGLFLAKKQTVEVQRQKKRADQEAANSQAFAEHANRKEQAAREAEGIAKKLEREAVVAQNHAEALLAKSNFQLSTERWKANRIHSAWELLYRVPSAFRNMEWFLAHRQMQGSDITCYENGMALGGVTFRSDGKQFVSGGAGNLRVFDSSTGKVLHSLPMRWRTSEWDSLNSEGTRLVSVSSDRLKISVWDIDSGQLIWRQKVDTTHQVAFSPDGSQVFSRGIGDVTLWDSDTGEKRFVVELMRDAREYMDNCVVFSPNGKQLATAMGRDGVIKLWDASSGDLIRSFGGHGNGCSVLEMVFSPDGRSLASGEGALGREIKLWDARSGEEILTLPGGKGFLFSHDGTRFATVIGSERSCKVWDVVTGNELLTLPGVVAPRSNIQFSPDDTRVACGSKNEIKVWDATSGETLMTLRGHSDYVVSLAFSPDGSRLASSSMDRTLKLWDLRTGNNHRTLRGHLDVVGCVSFSSDGKRIASGSCDDTIKLWDASSGEHLTTLEGHRGAVNSVDFSPDGSQVLSGSNDQTLKLWDSNEGKERMSLEGHANSVDLVKFSPDGTMILSGSYDKTFRLWSADTGVEDTAKSGVTGSYEVQSLAFSPSGNEVLVGSVGLRLWPMDLANDLPAPVVLDDDIWSAESLAFSQDGTLLAAGRKLSVVVWNVTEQEEGSKFEQPRSLNGHAAIVNSIGFSPDSTRILSGAEDDIMKLWDTKSGEEVWSFSGNSQFGSPGVYGVSRINRSSRPVVALSPSGTQIAMGRLDNTINVWDIGTDVEFKVLSGDTEELRHAVFGPDGQKVYAATTSGKVIVWDRSSGNRIDNDAYGKSLEISKSGFFLDPAFYDKKRLTWIRVSPDGRWLLSLAANSSHVTLVDREFKNLPAESAYRKAKAKLDLHWHIDQAFVAHENDDWYSAVFHHAWVLKADPNQCGAYDYLRWARIELEAQCNKENRNFESVVPLVVTEMLVVPRGDKLSAYFASKIREHVWGRVKSRHPVPALLRDRRPLCDFELESIRAVCDQFPEGLYFQTLAAAEYRLSNLELSVQAGHRSNDVLAAEVFPYQIVRRFPNPINLAILALAYHELGATNQLRGVATKWQRQFGEKNRGQVWWAGVLLLKLRNCSKLIVPIDFCFGATTQ